MLVRSQSGLALLYLPEKGEQRLGGRQLAAQWQRVDEQSPHGLDAGDLRWPARHGHAEDHILASGEAPEQNRPGGLDQGVERQPLAAALLDQRRSEERAQG